MLTAKDVMTAKVVSVSPDTTVSDIARLFLEKRISAVPVVDSNGGLLGIVSEGDLMRRPETGIEPRHSWWLRLIESPEESAAGYAKSHGLCAEDVMTRDVVTVAVDAPLAEIATLLERRRIKRVPVVSDGKPVGIVSRANLLHGLVAKEKAPVGRDEVSIRAAVLGAVRETGIDEVSVNVVVSGGTVQIWGVVDSEAERQALRIAAEQTPGVKAVENHVAIISPRWEGQGWA